MGKEKQCLEDFSLPQLNILLKHLRLGYDHLKLLLTANQLEELLDWCDLSEEQKVLISATKIEKLGNMSLIINTILTSTFGAWMGLSGCVGCGLGSFKMLFAISFVAFFVSGLIGYMSLKFTQSQAKAAIQSQLIHNFQLKVLKLINQKLSEKTQSVAFYLNTAVSILKNQKDVSKNESFALNELKTTQEAYRWFEELNRVVQSRFEEVSFLQTNESYQRQIQQSNYLIKKTIAKHVQFVESLSTTKDQEKKKKRLLPTLPFLKVLTNPSYGIPKYQSMAAKSWIQLHLPQILLGMVPTIWGGFASMFVFVGGIPNIARELQFLWVAEVLTQPFARMIEIGLAGTITCYFAFAFLYSFRKGWQRQKLLEKIEKEIGNEDAVLLENNHRLTMLYKVKAQTQRLISIFNVLKKVEMEVLDQVEEVSYPH